MDAINLHSSSCILWWQHCSFSAYAFPLPSALLPERLEYKQAIQCILEVRGQIFFSSYLDLSNWQGFCQLELLFLKEQSTMVLNCFAASPPFKPERQKTCYTTVEKTQNDLDPTTTSVTHSHPLFFVHECLQSQRLEVKRTILLRFPRGKRWKKVKGRRNRNSQISKVSNRSVINHISSLVPSLPPLPWNHTNLNK